MKILLLLKALQGAFAHLWYDLFKTKNKYYVIYLFLGDETENFVYELMECCRLLKIDKGLALKLYLYKSCFHLSETKAGIERRDNLSFGNFNFLNFKIQTFILQLHFKCYTSAISKYPREQSVIFSPSISKYAIKFIRHFPMKERGINMGQSVIDTMSNFHSACDKSNVIFCTFF